jgi:SAM-dependent methyltransferase
VIEITELEAFLQNIFNERLLSKAVLSTPMKKNSEGPKKIAIKPFETKGEVKYQLESYFENKVFHENLSPEEASERAYRLLTESFRQGDFKLTTGEFQVLTSKKRISRIKEISSKAHLLDLSHNREKNYIIREGEPVDFLIHLGVMAPDGTVYRKKYDKFRQINKFLELADDVADSLKDRDVINIVDFGCGKSYLTFALYYYLTSIKDKKVSIIGMDLKQDVIDFCNKTAEELNYEDLQFLCGDIKDFNPSGKVDMVVTLHACDIATDIALANAVRWGAEVIMSVPCCQHELFDKVENKELSAMLKHGIIKERLSALITDSLRGSALEVLGYSVQILEFIDMEHTPKNIMIRAVKGHKPFRKEKVAEYRALKEAWGLDDIFIENYMGDMFKIY